MNYLKFRGLDIKFSEVPGLYSLNQTQIMPEDSGPTSPASGKATPISPHDHVADPEADGQICGNNSNINNEDDITLGQPQEEGN